MISRPAPYLMSRDEVAARFVLPGVGERTEIHLSRYGPEAGLRGAALLAGQELEAEGAQAEGRRGGR